MIAAEVPDFRQRTLSAAAKIKLIVSEEDRSISDDELQALAEPLGWRLSQSVINEAVGVLMRLSFIERS